jgi:hypothetical protein
MKKLPVMLPVASKLVSVPTEVIFGWAAVVSTPVKKLAVAALPKFALLAVTLLVTLMLANVKEVVLSSMNPGSLVIAIYYPVIFCLFCL